MRQATNYDLTDLEQVKITGWLTDCTDGITYPLGTCADGYFMVDENGWKTWPDAKGLLRGITYALTGMSA